MEFANYGQERDLICTEEERAVFTELEAVCSGLDLPDPLRLVRVSDNYVTAKIGDWELARIKYTNRAKWIVLPIKSNDKLRIGAPEDVAIFSDDIVSSVEHIVKYF
jgi:hypothetical protein